MPVRATPDWTPRSRSRSSLRCRLGTWAFPLSARPLVPASVPSPPRQSERLEASQPAVIRPSGCLDAVPSFLARLRAGDSFPFRAPIIWTAHTGMSSREASTWGLSSCQTESSNSLTTPGLQGRFGLLRQGTASCYSSLGSPQVQPPISCARAPRHHTCPGTIPQPRAVGRSVFFNVAFFPSPIVCRCLHVSRAALAANATEGSRTVVHVPRD